MRNSLIMLIIVLAISAMVTAQIKVDANGNYISTSSRRDTVDTGKTYTDSKGATYKVFKSATGKLYVPRVSKTGHYYRYYLKVN